MQELAERLREQLGPETEIRFAPRLQMLFVRVVAADTPYWIGVPVPPRSPADELPTRALTWTLVVLALLLAAAFVFARYLARPLRELTVGGRRASVAARRRRRCPRRGRRRSPRSIAASTR